MNLRINGKYKHIWLVRWGRETLDWMNFFSVGVNRNFESALPKALHVI
jgi:hypothetical protein